MYKIANHLELVLRKMSVNGHRGVMHRKPRVAQIDTVSRY